jgi:hypothetical protein
MNKVQIRNCLNATSIIFLNFMHALYSNSPVIYTEEECKEKLIPYLYDLQASKDIEDAYTRAQERHVIMYPKYYKDPSSSNTLNTVFSMHHIYEVNLYIKNNFAINDPKILSNLIERCHPMDEAWGPPDDPKDDDIKTFLPIYALIDAEMLPTITSAKYSPSATFIKSFKSEITKLHEKLHSKVNILQKKTINDLTFINFISLSNYTLSSTTVVYSQIRLDIPDNIVKINHVLSRLYTEITRVPSFTTYTKYKSSTAYVARYTLPAHTPCYLHPSCKKYRGSEPDGFLAPHTCKITGITHLKLPFPKKISGLETTTLEVYIIDLELLEFSFANTSI